MSFLRHREIYRSDGLGFRESGARSGGLHAPTHRFDEFPAGYSLAGCAPAEPASASPAEQKFTMKAIPRPSFFQRMGKPCLAGCLTSGVHRGHLFDVVVLKEASESQAGPRKRVPQGLLGMQTYQVGSDSALAINDHCCWDSTNLKLLGDLVSAVHQSRESIAVSSDEFSRFLLRLAVDPKQDQASAGEIPVQHLELRHAPAAHPTPGSPKVQHHDFASQRTQPIRSS